MKATISLLGSALLASALILADGGSVLAAVHYVDLNSTNATPPYTNWATAATNIQDAVDAAVAGDEVVAANGTYSTGWRAGYLVEWQSGPGPNRLLVDKPLTIRSVNGPQFTIIDGGYYMRCVCMTNGASLSGFTLGHGYVQGYNSPAYGGGAYGGTLNNCLLDRNSISNVTFSYGGGAAFCTLNNCKLTGNFIGPDFFNSGAALGGGAYGCTLNNCTLVNNAVPASLYGGPGAGGAAYCTLNNCISFRNFYYNVCEDCGSPGRLTDNNWFGDPLFVDGDGRLQSNSPCINAGNNAYVVGSTDLDGNPRIAGGTVDIGAYEFQSPASMISYAWLQQYGLPINSSTDTADPDGDAVDNYHEWLAGTNPTNRLSSPAQLAITQSGIPPNGIILTWSTNAVGFTLQSTTNLLSPSAWVTNSPAPAVIARQNTVTNPISGAQQFYRLIR